MMLIVIVKHASQRMSSHNGFSRPHSLRPSVNWLASSFFYGAEPLCSSSVTPPLTAPTSRTSHAYSSTLLPASVSALPPLAV